MCGLSVVYFESKYMALVARMVQSEVGGGKFFREETHPQHPPEEPSSNWKRGAMLCQQQ